MRANNVNGLIFSGNTVDNGGFFDNKKIAKTESISVFAEVNSQI